MSKLRQIHSSRLINRQMRETKEMDNHTSVIFENDSVVVQFKLVGYL